MQMVKLTLPGAEYASRTVNSVSCVHYTNLRFYIIDSAIPPCNFFCHPVSAILLCLHYSGFANLLSLKTPNHCQFSRKFLLKNKLRFLGHEILHLNASSPTHSVPSTAFFSAVLQNHCQHTSLIMCWLPVSVLAVSVTEISICSIKCSTHRRSDK